MDKQQHTDGSISHRQFDVDGISIHAAIAGDANKQAILLLHGYPQNWKAFEGVMHILKDHWYVIAIDLPGVGQRPFRCR